MILSAAADLLLGGQCLGCGRPGRSLCAECRRSLVPVIRVVRRIGLDIPVIATGVYAGPLRHLLPAYKDAQALQLGRPLARMLADGLVAAGIRAGNRLVPLPSTPTAVRRRGYAHVERLARLASAWIEPAPELARVLRVHDHTDQTTLSATGRRENLVGTMSATCGRGEVMLCDDIVTTGATLIEAARALHCAGYSVVGAVVVAETLSTAEMRSLTSEGE